MKPEFKMALMVWKDSIEHLETKKIEIYENPIKSGEYFLKLIQSSQISVGEQLISIDCERKLYTVGQHDSSVTSKVDLHRLETAIRSLAEEYDERIADAIEELINRRKDSQSPKNLEDFY